MRIIHFSLLGCAFLLIGCNSSDKTPTVPSNAAASSVAPAAMHQQDVPAVMNKEESSAAPSADAPSDNAQPTTWTVTLVATTPTSSTGQPCKGGAGTVTINGSNLTGTVKTDWGYELDASATVADDGTIKGGIAKGGQNAGTFGGTLGADGGEGTWKDAYGCEGTLTLAKAS